VCRASRPSRWPGDGQEAEKEQGEAGSQADEKGRTPPENDQPAQAGPPFLPEGVTMGRRAFYICRKQQEQERKPAGFACPVCGRVCKSKIGLQSHLRTHRKEVAT